MVNKGKRYHFNGHFESKAIALSLFSLLFIQPGFSWDYASNVNALLDEAGLAYDRGQYSSAKQAYRHALELEPNCPDAYNGLGLCAFKEGDISLSSEFYTSALGKKWDHYNALYNLANNCYIQEKYDDAIKYYTQVLKVSEKGGKGADADLYASLANVFRDRAEALTGELKRRDESAALEYYNRALQKNPNHFKAHANLGRFYLDERQFGAAEKELRAAIALQPDYSFAYYELGRLYGMRNEKPAALVAYYNSIKKETVESQKADTFTKIKAMGMDPALFKSFAQGFEDLSLGNWDAAAAEFESAASSITDPKQVAKKAVALNNAGYARARAGDLTVAMDSFLKALKLCPHGQPQIHYNLGQCFLQNKRYAEAEKSFRDAISEAKGNHFLAHNSLGIVLRIKSDTDKKNSAKYLNDALSEYNVALMQSSDALSVASYNRGIVLEKLGQSSEAKKSYNLYLQTSPTGLNAASARQRLEKLK